MTIESLRQLIHAQPFRPFDVLLADGRSVRVKHPDFIAHSPGSRTTVIFTEGEAFEVIDLLLIVSLKVGNGVGRRKK